MSPVILEQPVAQVGHARVVGLVGAVGRLKVPPPDELVVGEADPEAESVDLLRGCHPPQVADLDLLPRAGPSGEVAHHVGIRVELDLPFKVLVGERDEGDPLSLESLLGHGQHASAREQRCLTVLAVIDAARRVVRCATCSRGSSSP